MSKVGSVPGRRDALLLRHSDHTWSCIPWDTKAIFTGIVRPKREADYSLASSAEVKRAWSFT
jgi:hypothetical protein